MKFELKQRIVGVIVLTALAIIILPLLLDGDEQDRARIVKRMPTPPEIDLAPANVEQLTAAMNRLQAESDARLPKELYSDGDPLDSTLDANSLPVSWSLQVASFEDLSNATKLRSDLRSKGFRSYMLNVTTESGDRIRVLVGPMLQRDRLRAIQDQIEAEFHLQCRILRYNVDDDINQLGG